MDITAGIRLLAQTHTFRFDDAFTLAKLLGQISSAKSTYAPSSGKNTESWGDYSPSSNTLGKDAWRCTSTSPYIFLVLLCMVFIKHKNIIPFTATWAFQRPHLSFTIVFVETASDLWGLTSDGQVFCSLSTFYRMTKPESRFQNVILQYCNSEAGQSTKEQFYTL